MRTTRSRYSASVCAWPVRSLRARGGAAGSFQAMKRARSAPTLPASPSARQTAAPRIRAIRMSRLDLTRGDRVLEVVGVETVATALRRLGLRIHQEAELAALGRARQRHIVSGVEGHPVAFPSAEQLGPQGLDHRMVDLQPFARLLARHLCDVRRIHRHPAVVFQEDLGAAVLSLADVRASGPQRLVAEGRRRDANAVDVTRGAADGADETHEERGDVAHLPPKLRVSSIALMSPTPQPRTLGSR